MPDRDESEIKKYIHKLESRLEALEKSVEERMHNFSEWFKRIPAETPASTTAASGDTYGERELRMVLMGPPGAGT